MKRNRLTPSIVAGIALYRRGDKFGTALCLWLLGFSIVDMAVYMYDAFDPVITLLGGGTIILPGMTSTDGTTNPPQFNLAPIWRRTSWNEMLNNL